MPFESSASRLVVVVVITCLIMLFGDTAHAQQAGGRSVVTDSLPAFGSQVEQNRLFSIGNSLVQEKGRISKLSEYATSESRKLAAMNQELKTINQSIDSEREYINTTKNNYVCPNCSRSMEGCFKVGNAPAQTYDMLNWYNKENDRLNLKIDSYNRKLRTYNVARNRLVEFKDSLAAQMREFNRKNRLYRSYAQASKSKRSPDEGLFFDDSTPKSQGEDKNFIPF